MKSRSELASIYKKQFMKLDAAECAGQDVSKIRIKLLDNYVKDLNEINSALANMLYEEKTAKEGLMCREEKLSCLLENTTTNLEQVQQQTDMLQSQQMEVCSEISSIKGELDQTLQDLQTADCEVTALNEQIAEQECIMAENKRVLDEIGCKLEMTRDDNRDLSERIECTEELIQSLCQQKEELENCQQELCAEIAKEKEAAMKNSETMKRLNQELEALERELRDKDNQIKCLEDELCRNRQEMERLCQVMGNAECALEEEKTNNVELNKQLISCGQYAEQLEGEKTCLEEELVEYKETHTHEDGQVNRYEQHMCETQERLHAAQQDMAECRQMIAQTQSQGIQPTQCTQHGGMMR